jgi:predicted dithiol-disulfide oxidoreductase (DUF899 family)
MESPKIVSCEEWFAARTALLAKEKEFTRQRDHLITTHMVLDLTPKGRNETGPHHNLMDWVRRHDEYDKAEDSQSCCAE